jgi:propanol-preferring alcohol dehydrogenase
MKAMVVRKIAPVNGESEPLELADLPVPVPQENEVLIKISACGVCHTELDEIEGRTPPSKLPVIPGHQVIGRVSGMGRKATKFKAGDRIGVAWIFSACGRCKHCCEGHENLCNDFMATGRDTNGGYAEYMVVPEDFVYPIPEIFSDSEAAPLLCAGAVGYRSLRLTNMKDGFNIGLTGFGASGHIVLKIILYRYPNSGVFVFARSESERIFARELGAVWVGDIEDIPPVSLDCIIDTTPAWKPVIESLGKLRPGGRLIINAIRKESFDQNSLLNLDYAKHLWMEKEIKSVANVTRRDVKEFLSLAGSIPIRPEIQEYHLEEANRALIELKERKIKGAKVLNLSK